MIDLQKLEASLDRALKAETRQSFTDYIMSKRKGGETVNENTMKVKSRKYGIIHFYAQCSDCAWDAAIGKEVGTQDVRNKITAHVKKTGHTVKLETGTSTDYYLG